MLCAVIEKVKPFQVSFFNILVMIFLARLVMPLAAIYIWIEYWPQCGNVKIVSPDTATA